MFVSLHLVVLLIFSMVCYLRVFSLQLSCVFMLRVIAFTWHACGFGLTVWVTLDLLLRVYCVVLILLLC